MMHDEQAVIQYVMKNLNGYGEVVTAYACDVAQMRSAIAEVEVEMR